MAYTTINDPTQHFNTVLYTGNGSSQTITGVGFQPDWVWIKSRSLVKDHSLHDSSRGGDLQLKTNTNEAESSNGNFGSIQSDGFSLLLGGGAYNQSGATYTSWNWLANGGTTSSNTDGSITSTVQANTTAGFSIVTGTSPSSGNWTAGHGLGSAPDVIILKGRSAATNWHVYHKDTGELGATFLNLTNAFVDAEYFGDTAPTSTVFYQNMGSAMDGDTTFVAYCFKSIKGYSKFGSYKGNGSADGTFVYTGFKPAWIVTKGATTAQAWSVRDNTRDSFNSAQKSIYANLSDAESVNVNNSIDLLSNGFKIRNLFGTENQSGETFIYMAFAESPFVSSDGVPTTAR